MNIVLEGCDASGKSTLARELSRELNRKVTHSSGPATLEALNQRAGEFLKQCNTIFDRHPCISEPIYCILRGNGKPLIDPEFVSEFYKQKSLIIYCRGVAGDHVARAAESQDHLKSIASNYVVIQGRYDGWAQEKAHIFYRAVDNDIRRIVAMVKGVIIHAS